METVLINENITAVVSRRTLQALKRDDEYRHMKSRFLDEEYAWLMFGEEYNDSIYPDWFWNYEPIKVFTF